jgi:hypothetical protein
VQGESATIRYHFFEGVVMTTVESPTTAGPGGQLGVDIRAQAPRDNRWLGVLVCAACIWGSAGGAHKAGCHGRSRSCSASACAIARS